MRLKNNKGITLMSLVVTVIILLAITGVIIYNTKHQVKMKKLNDLYIDIEAISAKVDEYYLNNGTLPVLCEYLEQENLIKLLEKSATEQEATIGYENRVNPNDGKDKYYVIDLGKLDGLTLNYGYDADYETVKTNGNVSSLSNLNAVEDEIYIINETSHQIYFPHGVVLDNVLYYWYDPIFLRSDKITQVVFNNDLTDIASDPLFLNVATYYKVGDKNA